MARLKYYNSSTQTWEYADNVAASTATDAVLFVEQTINDQQKEQARKNIDAASSQDVGDKNQLQTENKNDLVSAINELYNREDQVGENPLPEYTEEDYGKVLSPTEDGLTWKELEINSEEGTEVFIQPEEPSDAVIGDFWWDTDEEASGGSGGAAAIPTFNLTEMGLPTVPMDGTFVSVETDTTAIRAALDSGLIKVTFNMNFKGYVIPVTSIDRGTYIAAEDNYQVCTMSHTYNGTASEHTLYTAVFNIHSTDIEASIVGTGLALPDAEEATF